VPTTTAQRVLIGTVGLAVLGIGISQIGVGPKLTKIYTGTTGILSGTGTSGDPVSMTLTSDGTTVTGTGSGGSQLVANPGLALIGGFLFGDGSDGDCNFDGVNPVGADSPATPGAQETVLPGTTKEYLLTSWKFCSTAEIASNVAVETVNPLFVRDTLQLDGLVHHNGCHSNANSTACSLGSSHNGWLQGSSVPESASGGFRMSTEADKSSLTNCAAAVGQAAAGNNGASIYGCGGGGGGYCASASPGTGRASPKNTVATTPYGSAELQFADGYCSQMDGFNGTCSTGGSGGGDASDGSNLVATGGGAGGWVVLHARKITGSGQVQAVGGVGWTATGSTTCYGGGGGGGGGWITLVIGSGTYPTTSVAGGVGAAGQHCNTCNGGGAGTGGKGGDGYQGELKEWRLGLP
jgi:hypothetical protein